MRGRDVATNIKLHHPTDWRQRAGRENFFVGRLLLLGKVLLRNAFL